MWRRFDQSAKQLIFGHTTKNILAPRRRHGVRVAAFRSASPVVYTSFRVIAVVFTDEDRELLTKNAPRVISSTCRSSSSSISHAGNVLSTGNLIPRTLMSCLKASWPVFEKACATTQNNVKSLLFGSWKKRKNVKNACSFRDYSINSTWVSRFLEAHWHTRPIGYSVPWKVG